MDKFAWQKALRGAKDLTHAEFRVLVNLATWTDEQLGNAFPGNAQLFEAACVSQPTGKKALRTLQDKGWLILQHRGGGRRPGGNGISNVYSVTTPKGVSQLPPTTDDKGVNGFQEGGKSFSEGGKPVSQKGVSQLATIRSIPTHTSDHEQVLDPVERDPLPPHRLDEAPLGLAARFGEALGEITTAELSKIEELWDRNHSYYKILAAIRADRGKPKRSRSA